MPTDGYAGAPLEPLMNDEEVAAALRMSTVTVWRHVAQGKLPAPIKLGRLSRWPRSEIFGHIEKAMAARGGAYRGNRQDADAGAPKTVNWEVRHANP